MSKRPQTPWEDYCHRSRFLNSFSSYFILGLFLVALALLIKV